MTAITHPLTAKHHVVGVVVTAVVTAGLSIGLTLGLSTSGTSQPSVQFSSAGQTLCQQLARTTPGSPAAFRLADAISTRGSC